MADDNENDEKALTPSTPKAVLNLGASAPLDLSQLPEEQQHALMAEYAHNRIDMARKAEELGVEVRALEESLRVFAGTAQEATESGNAVTISHTRKSANGETDIVIGNTEEAQRGRVARHQTGERDWTPYYVGGGLLALVLIVGALAANGGG